MNFAIVKENTAKMVYANDLNGLLAKLNVLNRFNKGKCKCRYCKSVITRNNLMMILPNDNTFEYCCSEPKCIYEACQESN